MSTKIRSRALKQIPASAPVFAALGDETRLTLLVKLSHGSPLSITQLTQGSTLTRQAITKHLRVLESAGLVGGLRQGRENLFKLKPESLDDAKRALEIVSRQWDQALARLKSYVES
jgi:DNA-binding transcriptional ArsR family regulator